MEGDDGRLEAYSLTLGFVPAMVAKAVCELEIPDLLAAHQQEPLSALQILQRLRPTLPFTRPLHEAAQLLDRIMLFMCAFKVFKAHVGLHVDNALGDENLSLQVDGHARAHFDPNHGHHVVVDSGHLDKNFNLQVDGITSGHIDADHCHDTVPPTKYSITPVSKWLQQSGASLRGFLLFETSSPMQAAWQHLSQGILSPMPPFNAAHSMDVWGLATLNPSFSCLFNGAMSSASTLSLETLFHHYNGFQDGVSTLVDVGGGTGTIASSIVARYPSIKAINFDLPHVIATAPVYLGVEHIGGDMFKSIPKGDAIFMKWILHAWNDEDCIKILGNCHKVLPKHGKLILMEGVVDLTFVKDSPFNNARIALDMGMIAHTTSGKERTKQQWEILLEAAKFRLCRIIDLPCPQCIIEAIPI